MPDIAAVQLYPTHPTLLDYPTRPTVDRTLTHATCSPIPDLRYPMRGTSDVFQWANDGTLWDG